MYNPPGDNNNNINMCNQSWMVYDCPPLTPAVWSKDEDKAFEQSLAVFPEDLSDRWQRIADRIHGKTAEDVRAHYDALLHDVCEIEAGRVEVPNYADDDDFFGWQQRPPHESRTHQINFGQSGKAKHGDGERKKGNPWTAEEHRKFLIGLERYGRGDWRSISRNVVVTRTPTQVASHAQKFYIRQNNSKKERKRSSIHDITTPLDGGNSPNQPGNSPNQSGNFPNQPAYRNFGFPDQ